MAIADDESGDTPDTDDEPTTERTVTINAYARNIGKTARKLMDELDDRYDYFEQTDRTSVSGTLTVGDLEINLRSVKAKKLRDTDPELGDDVSLEIDEETTLEYEHSGYSAATAVADRVLLFLQDVDDEALGDGFEWNNVFNCYEDADGRERINFRKGSVKNRKVLRHPEKRSADDRFETGTDGEPLEVPSVQFTVELGPATDEQIATWSELVVEPLVSNLSTLEPIGKVRVADCETTKKGDCYSV